MKEYKEYIFHYDLEHPCPQKSYHESLMLENGKKCKADIADADKNITGLIEAYFEDGTELDVFIRELEEV